MKQNPSNPILIPLLLFGILAAWNMAAGTSLPPDSSPFYIQTSGRTSDIGRGDWYSVGSSNGIGDGYHFFRIYVPDGWPSTEPIHVDIQSPEMNSNEPTGTQPDDEIIGTAQNTRFEMFPGSVVIDPHDPRTPAPGTGISGSLRTYTPSTQSIRYIRFYTITNPVPGSTYVIRADATTNDGENSYRIRIGRDNDTNPRNTPPTNLDNYDGIEGTDDELQLAFIDTSFQHSATGVQCTTFYTWIPAAEPSIVFDNFEMDGNTRVRYYAPSQTYDATGQTGGTIGTISGNAAWNNGGTITTRVGDTIANPENGYYRIVDCITANNQFIQEGIAGLSLFMEKPRQPVISLSKTADMSVAGAGTTIEYTIHFANNATGTSAGAAKSIVITDTLDPETTYLAGTINSPFTGTIGHNAGQITITINEKLDAGQSGTVTIIAKTADPLSGDTLVNNVSMSYIDSLKNLWPTLYATNTIDTAPLLAVLADFSAKTLPDGTVLVTWQTLEETGTLGFFVHRAIPADNRYALGNQISAVIPATGTPTSGSSYTFLDTAPLSPGEQRTYYLLELELSGTTRLLGPSTSTAKETRIPDWEQFR